MAYKVTLTKRAIKALEKINEPLIVLQITHAQLVARN
jgi:hypothetical protein